MEQIQEGKLNWETNLSCCKRYTQKKYSGLLLVFLHRFWTFCYSICLQNYRTNRERSVMLYFFIFFYYYYFFYFYFLFLIYLSESSEISYYSCDFCQHNSRIWTADVNINNAMYIVPLPFCYIYSLIFLVCFLYGLGSLTSLFWVFSNIKLSNMPKVILIKNPTLILCLYLLK